MSRVSIAVLRVLLALIFLGALLAQIVIFPIMASQTAQQFPELGWLQWPMLAIVWLVILGVQVGLVAIWVLLGMVQHDRVFTADAFRWVNVIIGAAVGDTALVLGAHILLVHGARVGPPALMMIQLALVLGGAAFALLMVVMKGLLRRACEATAELSVVI